MMVVSYVGYKSNRSIAASAELQQKVSEKYALTQAMRLHMEQQVATCRAFLLTGDEKHLADYEKAKNDFDDKQGQLAKSVWTAEGRDIANRLKELHPQYSAAAQKEIDLMRAKQVDEARSLNVAGLSSLRSAIRDLLGQAEETWKQQQEEAAKEQSSRARNATMLSIVISLIAIATGIVIGIFPTRSIATGLGRVSGLMKETAEGVAAGDGDLTKRLPTSHDEIGALRTLPRIRPLPLPGKDSNATAKSKLVAFSFML